MQPLLAYFKVPSSVIFVLYSPISNHKHLLFQTITIKISSQIVVVPFFQISAGIRCKVQPILAACSKLSSYCHVLRRYNFLLQQMYTLPQLNVDCLSLEMTHRCDIDKRFVSFQWGATLFPVRNSKFFTVLVDKQDSSSVRLHSYKYRMCSCDVIKFKFKPEIKDKNASGSNGDRLDREKKSFFFKIYPSIHLFITSSIHPFYF